MSVCEMWLAVPGRLLVRVRQQGFISCFSMVIFCSCFCCIELFIKMLFKNCIYCLYSTSLFCCDCWSAAVSRSFVPIRGLCIFPSLLFIAMRLSFDYQDRLSPIAHIINFLPKITISFLNDFMLPRIDGTSLLLY